VHDPFVDHAEVTLTDLDELLARSDVVTLHMPLSPQTRAIIDARTIALMRPGAVIVNTARGPVIDQDALVDALRGGHLGAAGLDVFEVEPPLGSPLLELPNVILSPHVGGISDASNLAMSRMATASVLEALQNRSQ
jgi:phosphoglycerate dehydrogenase-like enzyme